jgi:hypothetical protein
MTDHADHASNPAEQLPFDGLMPREGDQYRSLHAGGIFTVTEVIHRRHTYVQLRGNDRVRQVALGVLDRYYAPYPKRGPGR